MVRDLTRRELRREIWFLDDDSKYVIHGWGKHSKRQSRLRLFGGKIFLIQILNCAASRWFILAGLCRILSFGNEFKIRRTKPMENRRRL